MDVKHLRNIVIVGALLLLAAPASAETFSLNGGRLLKTNESAINIQIGYPGLRVGYHIPIIKDLEIVPHLSLHWAAGDAYGLVNSVPADSSFGLRPGANLRYAVYSKDRVHVALEWRVGFPFNVTPLVLGAVQIGLPGGVHVTWEASRTVNLVAGLQASWGTLLTSPTVFIFSNVFDIGVEVEVANNLNLTAQLEGGPVGFVGGGAISGLKGVGGYLGGFIGVQYRM